MKLFPAIDLLEGKAVRLLRGDYEKMTVFSTDPVSVARDFEKKGAKYIHLVDLEGARDGGTPALPVVKRILESTSLFAEIGGGIRDITTVDRYMDAGVGRVILGTAAVTDPGLLERALDKYGERIAVGVDMKDGFVAIRGWLDVTENEGFAFMRRMQALGVGTVICTDVSRDGMMMGTNRDLYRRLAEELSLNIIASGGVSSLEDIATLRDLGLYGAILGKAYYTGKVDLSSALEVADDH